MDKLTIPESNPFSLSTEQTELREWANDFAKREFAPRAAMWESEGRFPWENVETLAREGLLGLSLPARFGGRERPLIDAVLVLEQIARHCFATAEIVQLCVNGPAYAIAKLGSESLQERYLPKVVRGECLVGISITEEQAGSSVGETQATARPDGEGWIVEGRKSFTTAGDVCGAFQVLVRFGGSGLKGLGSIIVDAGTPGFSVERTFDKMGGNAIKEAALRFEGCRVSGDDVPIPGDSDSTSGFKATMNAYNRLRCGIASICLGVAQAALDEIGRFLNHRRQFGAALASFQGLRWRVARLAAELEATRLLVYRAAHLTDAHGFPLPHETAIAKLKASELAVRATDEAVQMLGSRGVLRDFPAERRYREIRGWTIAGGTNEMLLDAIGSKVLRGYRE